VGTILVALSLGAGTATEIFLAWSLGSLVLIGIRKRYRLPFPTFELALPVRQTALHLMIGQLLFVAFMRLDLIALAIIGKDAAGTAHYSAVARFAEAGFLLFSPAVNVLQMEFRQRIADRFIFTVFMRKIALGAMVFALAGTLVGSMAAPWLLTVAFGLEYAEAAPLLGWALSALILMLPSQVLAQAAIALNCERTVWTAYAVGLPVALIAAIVLVPSHGALGTAWSMLIGHGSVMLVLVLSLRENLKYSR
jgi:O-antigen/teichoic acid export membrane protein